jgi:hypothetical protein
MHDVFAAEAGQFALPDFELAEIKQRDAIMPSSVRELASLIAFGKRLKEIRFCVTNDIEHVPKVLDADQLKRLKETADRRQTIAEAQGVGPEYKFMVKSYLERLESGHVKTFVGPNADVHRFIASAHETLKRGPKWTYPGLTSETEGNANFPILVRQGETLSTLPGGKPGDAYVVLRFNTVGVRNSNVTDFVPFPKGGNLSVAEIGRMLVDAVKKGEGWIDTPEGKEAVDEERKRCKENGGTMVYVPDAGETIKKAAEAARAHSQALGVPARRTGGRGEETM